MTRHLITLAAASLMTISAVAAPKAINVSNFADMAPYVHPNNGSKSVAKPYFMPDGQSYLQLQLTQNASSGMTYATERKLRP